MLQDKQAKEEEGKWGRQAGSNRPSKGVARGQREGSLAAGEDADAERGDGEGAVIELSRSTRRDVTWPNRRSDLRLPCTNREG